MASADLVVVGAGIVGLAVARTCLERFPSLKVTVLEAEGRLAAHQTSHNSGVLHSGVYYEPGSLKARLSVEGHRLLREFCREHGVAVVERGKLLVASDDAGIRRLERLRDRALANGIEGSRWLDTTGIAAVEPAAVGKAALHLPQTATVDFAAVARALAADIGARGGVVELRQAVRGGRRSGDSIELRLGSGDRLHADAVLACAGPYADRAARSFGVDPGVSIVPFRGRYLRITRGAALAVRGLVYPVPDPDLPFLGVHVTRAASGEVLAGPTANLSWSRRADRDWVVTDALALLGGSALPRFAWRNRHAVWAELRRGGDRGAWARELSGLIPGVVPEDLQPGWSGVRAQAMLPDGRLVEDFHFASGERSLHVLNAPSPAATASLAIAALVVDRAVDELGIGT